MLLTVTTKSQISTHQFFESFLSHKSAKLVLATTLLLYEKLLDGVTLMIFKNLNSTVIHSRDNRALYLSDVDDRYAN